MLENAAFLMQEDYVNAWPLICDPTSRVLDWLYQYKHDKGLVVVRYSVSVLTTFKSYYTQTFRHFWGNIGITLQSVHLSLKLDGTSLTKLWNGFQ